MNRDRSAQPYEYRDFMRLAASACKHPAETPLVVAPYAAGWTNGASVAIVGPPVRWWIHGFVPKGELVMMHGFGSAGKSSFASYLASVVIGKGGNFGRIGSEEPFRRFLVRTVMGSNSDPSKLHDVQSPLSIRLPLTKRNDEFLREAVEVFDLKVLYFDSVKSHFESLQGLDAGDRARTCLAPLADLAVQTGCTVVCTFHDRRGGGFSGAAEMENVARVRLELQRPDDGPSTLSVRKTNFKDVKHHIRLLGEMKDIVDKETGEPQLEEDEETGALVPQSIFCVTHHEKAEGEVPESSETILAEANESRKRTAQTKAEMVREFADTNPEFTQTELAEHFKVSTRTIRNYMASEE